MVGAKKFKEQLASIIENLGRDKEGRPVQFPEEYQRATVAMVDGLYESKVLSDQNTDQENFKAFSLYIGFRGLGQLRDRLEPKLGERPPVQEPGSLSKQ